MRCLSLYAWCSYWSVVSGQYRAVLVLTYVMVDEMSITRISSLLSLELVASVNIPEQCKSN
jgi:hypothetical protein